MRSGRSPHILTLAALAAFASATGLGGQTAAAARADVSTRSDFERKVRERIAMAGGWAGGAHPNKTNGGHRRKRAIREARLRKYGTKKHGKYR